MISGHHERIIAQITNTAFWWWCVMDSSWSEEHLVIRCVISNTISWISIQRC